MNPRLSKKDIQQHKNPDIRPDLMHAPEFFKRLIDSLEEYAIFIVDIHGRVASWNAGAQKILGYTEKEILGKDFSQFFTPEDKAKKIPEAEIVNALNSHHPLNEGWRVKKGNKLFWATGFVFPFRDMNGNVIGFTKIMRDRTDRKRLEQHKDLFIGAASHELKTPITSLKLFSDILSDQVKNINNADIVESAGIIQNQVERLVKLMNQLLDVSRIQSHNIAITRGPFDINELLRDTIYQIETTMPSHKIKFSTDVKSFVFADKVRIGQVLMNLITNAIKYSPGGKKVVVKATEKKTCIAVDVQDFGIGIPGEELNRIFDRFYRTSYAEQKHISGFGLGLYISSEIIKKHGGKILVKSAIDKGSTFSLCLPKADTYRISKTKR